eukprot:2946657-Amphidinium_carterae.1
MERVLWNSRRRCCSCPNVGIDSGRVSSASNNVLKLLDTRCYGGPVRHYAAVASSVKVAGEPMSRRVLCIFDTGTTGLALTEGAFNAYFGTVRKKDLWQAKPSMT